MFARTVLLSDDNAIFTRESFLFVQCSMPMVEFSSAVLTAIVILHLRTINYDKTDISKMLLTNLLAFKNPGHRDQSSGFKYIKQVPHYFMIEYDLPYSFRRNVMSRMPDRTVFLNSVA